MGEKKNLAGAAYGIIIILLIALTLSFVLSAPTQTAGGLTDPSNLPVKGHMNITLWADAAGWDTNHGPVNPTLYIPLDYLVNFTVIEEDGLPHTLTINTGPKETGATYTIVTTGELTQVIGAKYTAQYEFFKTGVYTYWCTVHPTTMVGEIIVNATASNSTASTSFDSTHASHSNPQNFLGSLSQFALEMERNYEATTNILSLTTLQQPVF
ncbi:MAG: cupredoxin domain-containing protein [Candidatus Thermoplasmatota archaeon]|jgi:hypothetical protein|nr:cupredoxin domain-containing protein [Candidatus Thermoplasmatota archaeon]MCL5790436.1 cupredoxin domain-containing protein [Candidatus Thermoplasmatota archaeon]